MHRASFSCAWSGRIVFWLCSCTCCKRRLGLFHTRTPDGASACTHFCTSCCSSDRLPWALPRRRAGVQSVSPDCPSVDYDNRSERSCSGVLARTHLSYDGTGSAGPGIFFHNSDLEGQWVRIVRFPRGLESMEVLEERVLVTVVCVNHCSVSTSKIRYIYLNTILKLQALPL